MRLRVGLNMMLLVFMVSLLMACTSQSSTTALEAAAVVSSDSLCNVTAQAGVNGLKSLNPKAQSFTGFVSLRNNSSETIKHFELVLRFENDARLKRITHAVASGEDGVFVLREPDAFKFVRSGRSYRIPFVMNDPYEGLSVQLLSVNNENCDVFVGNITRDEAAVDEDFLTYWNQVTPENSGKWGVAEPQRDSMNWTGLDAGYAFAKANGLPFKFHVLVWGQQQPGWLDALSEREQRAELEQWMQLVAERYPDIDMIDVVNEPLHAPATYKNALGGDGQTGWDWVITAFELARTYFPDSTLLLNDYNILYLESATSEYLEIIRLLQDRGLIDGIGVQAHFLERADLNVVQRNLDRLAETSLPIYVSELDINFENDARQANVFRDVFTVLYEHPAVKGVTLWGYKQDQHWQENAYLLRADGTKRPALEWLVCYLAGDTGCSVPVYTPEPRVGDGVSLKLEAEDYDDAFGVTTSGSVVSYVDDGDWLLFQNVTFDEAYTSLSIRFAKGSTEAGMLSMHLGSLDAPAVFSTSIPGTGDWNTFETLTADFAPLSGTYDVFIKFSDVEAVGNFDAFTFGLPVKSGTDERLVLEAEAYDKQAGIENFGSMIGYADDGDYMLFSNVLIKDAYTMFEATYARGADGTGSVNVHLDAPDGPLVASLTPENTGDYDTFVTSSTVLRASSGVHDVYVVFSGGEGLGNFDRFAFVAGDLPPRTGDEHSLRLEAESYDAGGQVESGAGVISYVDDGDMLVYKNVVFNSNYQRFITRYAKGNTDTASVSVHLDDPNTPPLVTLELASTGDWNAFVLSEAEFTGVSGQHDVYVRFSLPSLYGVGNFDFFEFTALP